MKTIDSMFHLSRKNSTNTIIMNLSHSNSTILSLTLKKLKSKGIKIKYFYNSGLQVFEKSTRILKRNI